MAPAMGAPEPLLEEGRRRTGLPETMPLKD